MKVLISLFVVAVIGVVSLVILADDALDKRERDDCR